MIQITLGRRRSIDPREDAFGRSQIGWTEGLSDQELHEIARGTWVMPGERVERERFVVSGGGTIRQAMEIDRVVDAPDGRRAFEGRILDPGHPVHDCYVGQPAPKGNQQNPITFFKSPLDNRKCNCGCGNPIERGDFLPGHDQRAIHERIARVGTVMDFITWFDETWKQEQDQQGEHGSFVTLFSQLFGDGGSLEAEVAPHGEEITIRTDRWSLGPDDAENGAWASGSVKFIKGTAHEVLLTIHNAESEPWRSLEPMAPHQVAQDLQAFLPHARARAIRPLRDLEEKLRRARYAAWVAERASAGGQVDAVAARSSVSMAAEGLAARGGQPDLVWPNPTHDDNGKLL